MSELPLSTAHRLVTELASWQMLRRGVDGRYSLISARPMPCTSGRNPAEIRELAAATVEDLAAALRSDVRLGWLGELRVSYAEKVFGTQPLSDISSAATLPAHATALGQVLLAFSAPAVVKHVVGHGLDRYTPDTLITPARLEHALRTIRLRGISVVTGELRRDHAAVAAPVFGPNGEITAAMDVRLHDVGAELPMVVPALTVAARAVSRDLGHARPNDPDERARSVGTVVALGRHGLRSRTASLGTRR